MRLRAYLVIVAILAHSDASVRNRDAASCNPSLAFSVASLKGSRTSTNFELRVQNVGNGPVAIDREVIGSTFMLEKRKKGKWLSVYGAGVGKGSPSGSFLDVDPSRKCGEADQRVVLQPNDTLIVRAAIATTTLKDSLGSIKGSRVTFILKDCGRCELQASVIL
jgi:hypothetical protein